jgi:DNA-binding transcriptional LysR family regulator
MEKTNYRILDMQKVNAQLLDGFDITDLRFLQALLDTGAISRAGQAFGMSQPSASRAMAQLRRQFGDPLLVRTSRGYVLTPGAELLREPVRRALDAMTALFESAEFVASTSTRTFRVASTDYGIAVALQPRLPSLRSLAPAASWQIDPWTNETLASLERGELDCALYADEPLSSDFHVRRIFADGYACVCRREHPLAAIKASSASVLLKEAAKYPQSVPRYLASQRHITDDVYAQLGLPPAKIVVATPYFQAGLQSVLEDDLVALVPQRLARLWLERYPVAVLPIVEKSLRFEYRLIWHERAHRDRGLLWFRKQLIEDSGD